MLSGRLSATSLNSAISMKSPFFSRIGDLSFELNRLVFMIIISGFFGAGEPSDGSGYLSGVSAFCESGFFCDDSGFGEKTNLSIMTKSSSRPSPNIWQLK